MSWPVVVLALGAVALVLWAVTLWEWRERRLQEQVRVDHLGALQNVAKEHAERIHSVETKVEALFTGRVAERKVPAVLR